MATSQDFVAWICSPALHPAYLMYLLMGERELLRRLGRGTAHPTIYFPEIRAFSIALAPFPEQIEIVRRLDQIFERLTSGDAEIEIASRLVPNFARQLHMKAFSGKLESVTQDIDLVDRALAASAAELEMKRPQRPVSVGRKHSATGPSAAEQLAGKYDVWPKAGYSFEELRDTLTGTYEDVRAAIFAELRGARLVQQFDARRRVMVLVRSQP